MPNYRPVFAFDSGQSIIYGYWEPGNDPDTVAAELMRLANATGNWSVPMQEAKMAVIEDTKDHFMYEEDPEGDAWEPLNDQYLAQKQEDGFPPDILIRTGEMKDVATSEEAWQVEEKTIMFHAELLPFYGAYHQEGEYAPKRMRRRAEARGISLGALRKPSGALPQREFIGISDQGADEIELIFRNWLDEQVTKYIPPPPRRPPGGGGIFKFLPGMEVQSTAGVFGTLTDIPAFGGGFIVRGAGGRFAKGKFNT